MTLSDKQRGFIDRLLNERVIPNDLRAHIIESLADNAYDRWGASRLIDELLKREVRPTAAATYAPMPEVKEGHYAVEIDGEVKFYKVGRPTEGRWAGFTFLDVQASDDYWPIRDQQTKRVILAAIAADPGALARYGQLLGVCGVCGRTLTDAESRRLGIGPVCRGRAA